jgi:hypothetical protein
MERLHEDTQHACKLNMHDSTFVYVQATNMPTSFVMIP